MKKPILVSILAILIPTVCYSTDVAISKNQMRDAWPFSVEDGILGCVPMPGVPNLQFVTFKTDKTTYAVNGTARMHAKRYGWKEIDGIWKDNPTIPGAKINISPLIDKGLALCK